jgi:ribonuclease HI
MVFFVPGTVPTAKDLPLSLEYDVTIYTDGSADNIRGGRIAFACSIRFNHGDEHYLTAYIADSAERGTSPYAELRAINLAMYNLLPSMKYASIQLYSDSEWAIRCIEGSNKRVKFLEEWASFDSVRGVFPNTKFGHCRGHVGITENEICDKLAHIVRTTGTLTKQQFDKVVNVVQNG